MKKISYSVLCFMLQMTVHCFAMTNIPIRMYISTQKKYAWLASGLAGIGITGGYIYTHDKLSERSTDILVHTAVLGVALCGLKTHHYQRLSTDLRKQRRAMIPFARKNETANFRMFVQLPVARQIELARRDLDEWALHRALRLLRTCPQQYEAEIQCPFVLKE